MKSSRLRNTLMLVPLIGATGSLVTALGLWLMFMVVTGALWPGHERLALAPGPGDPFAGQRTVGRNVDQLRGTRRAGLVAAMASACRDLCRHDRLAMRRAGAQRLLPERLAPALAPLWPVRRVDGVPGPAARTHRLRDPRQSSVVAGRYNASGLAGLGADR